MSGNCSQVKPRGFTSHQIDFKNADIYFGHFDVHFIKVSVQQSDRVTLLNSMNAEVEKIVFISDKVTITK